MPCAPTKSDQLTHHKANLSRARYPSHPSLCAPVVGVCRPNQSNANMNDVDYRASPCARSSTPRNLFFFVSIYGPQAGPMLIATHVVPKIGGIFPFSLGLPSPLRPRATACTDDGFPAPHRPDPLSRLPLRSYESTLPFSLDVCLWDLSSFVSTWPPKRNSTTRRGAAVEEDRDV